MGAGLLITDHADRVLLVQPAYKPDWEIPGGAVEADESPHAAARREAAEELGLTLQPGPLLAVDWVPPRDGRTEGLMLVFDGGRLTDAETTAIVLPHDELRSWHFSDPDAASRQLSPLLARRVAAALTARTRGQVAYLKNGYQATEGLPA
jgi:8-oxo-dGTP pyrophosphatase MutT (NUDIX family)